MPSSLLLFFCFLLLAACCWVCFLANSGSLSGGHKQASAQGRPAVFSNSSQVPCQPRKPKNRGLLVTQAAGRELPGLALLELAQALAGCLLWP